MQGFLRNLPERCSSIDRVSVLAVLPEPGDRTSLRNIFGHTRWQLFEAENCREALNFLLRNRVGVLICEYELADGNWRVLLEAVSALPSSPLLVVTSKDTDAVLWSEALNLGAYDVLSKPFEREEVTRIVSLAWLHWKEQVTSIPRKAAGGDAGNGGVQANSATA